MDTIQIRGGRPLNGQIHISGAKNAALPLMIASLLTRETLTLSNIPHLADIAHLVKLLAGHGVEISMNGGAVSDDGSGGSVDGRTLSLTAGEITSTVAPYELVRRMRASFWVLGPLVARCGHAEVSLPGGCAIGTRPVDLHLAGLEALGADIQLEQGYVEARAPNGLKGGEVKFPLISVGATINVLMAATLAEGTTVIENAAQEPEIRDLADCLNAMGAKIEGAGTSRIVIEGQAELGGTRHRVLPDRIETGTYAMAVGMTGGEVDLIGGRADLLGDAFDVLQQAGLSLKETNEGLRVSRNGSPLQPVEVSTAPYPGFATDLQAQLMALMTMASGTSRITETIFENRFMHVQELARLGADISLHGDTAEVHGVGELKGAPVMATDLRASVGLVIAALAAEGQTNVSRVYHLDRGFERLEEKLSQCGADIQRVREAT